GGVETFSEPVVDFTEHRTRFITTILRCEQPREAHRRTQFPRFRTHLARQYRCFTEVSLGQLFLSTNQPNIASYAQKLRSEYGDVRPRLERPFNRFERLTNSASLRLRLRNERGVETHSRGLPYIPPASYALAEQ